MLCDDVVCQLGPALISGRLCQLRPARYDPVCALALFCGRMLLRVEVGIFEV